MEDVLFITYASILGKFFLCDFCKMRGHVALECWKKLAPSEKKRNGGGWSDSKGTEDSRNAGENREEREESEEREKEEASSARRKSREFEKYRQRNARWSQS